MADVVSLDGHERRERGVDGEDCECREDTKPNRDPGDRACASDEWLTTQDGVDKWRRKTYTRREPRSRSDSDRNNNPGNKKLRHVREQMRDDCECADKSGRDKHE